MIIQINATLTNEQASILAKRKWYNETITQNNLETATFVEIPNTESPFEFLKRIYETVILEDATKEFIAYNDEKNQAIWEAEDKAIKDQVISSISSQIM